MRICIHSIRLAVSLLLGITFGVPLVAQPVQAVTSSFLMVTPTQVQLASNDIYCSYDSTIKSQMLYQSLTSLPVTRLMPYLPQTIASAKETPQSTISRITTPVVIPTAAISPTTTPAQSIVPVAQASEPAEVAPVAGSQLNAEVLFGLVNAHRVSIGLAPFQQDPRVCAVAASRAPELDHEIFGGGGMHAGFYGRNLGFFATENMISQNTEQAALQWWLNSPVHRSAIEGNYGFACVGCAGKSCAMIFTNFAPK